jgi:C1A family cysteine protease
LSKPASSTRLVPSFDDSSSNVDWRKWQVIGGVKDQGRCGGGYAFASAAAAESAYAIKTGNLHDLSE